MLSLIGRRLVQLLPTLFFVSVLIFSLQQLLPGDPALVMAGEEKRPRGDRADPAAVPARSAVPDPVPLLDQGRAHRRPRRVHAPQGAGARPHRPEAARDAPARRHGDDDRARHRRHGRRGLGGEEGHRRRLRRQRGRALGHLDAELLARDHADLPLRRAARLAAGLRLRQPVRGFGGRACATTIMPAFVLGNAIAGVIMRHTRSAMLQALESDYVRTARAKGLRERVGGARSTPCATRSPR